MNQPQQAVVTRRGDIFETLRSIDRGGLVHDLDDAVREVVLACVKSLKAGKVKLTIKFDPDVKSECMRVSAAIEKTLPPEPTKASIFFTNPDGTLQRIDPRQAQMFPEPAAQPAFSQPSTIEGTAREVVDPATGEVTQG